MQEFYKNIYRIIISYTFDSELRLDLVKNIKLFETKKGGFNGWLEDNNITQVVSIDPGKWGNICLLDYKSERNIEEILDAGAHITQKSYIYDNKIDARIQMGFIANKSRIKVGEIEKTSNGYITKEEYMKISECILEEFPEKLI